MTKKAWWVPTSWTLLVRTPPFSTQRLALRSRHGAALCKGGEYATAEAELAEVIRRRSATAGPGDHILVHARRWHLHALGRMGRLADAEDDLRFLAQAAAAQHGPDHRDVLAYRERHAASLWEGGRHEEAVTEMADVAARLAATLGGSNPGTLRAAGSLAAMTSGDEGYHFGFETAGLPAGCSVLCTTTGAGGTPPGSDARGIGRLGALRSPSERAMPHRILHLSDTHVTASGFDADGVDALAALDQILRDCRHLTDLDLVVVTGDIADDGSPEGCALVRDRVGRFAADRGIPHVYTTGNHDRRPGFMAALGTGHLGAQGADAGQLLSGLDDERAALSMCGGLRVITLDSLVPGSGHGVVSHAQLSALSELLRDPAPAGTILALHHPPIHAPTAPWMIEAGLHNRDELAAVVDGTDVAAVLCGHFHLQLTGRLGGTTVWATPGVVTRIDLTAPPHVVRAVNGAGATVIDLGGPFSPSFHVIHARDPKVGTEVYVVDPVTEKAAPQERPG